MLRAAADGNPAAASQSMPAPVSAQPAPPTKDIDDMSLAELTELKVGKVYGASRREQDATQAPSDVTLVTSDDIKLKGYRTLADILQGVRGFYVTTDRIYSYIGVRGLNRPGDFGGRVLITINGHRVNDPIADQAFNGDEFPLDVDLIDHVEVVRGPGSSLYGNNAFFTVVNVVTRYASGLDGPEVAASAASYDTYTGRVSYGQRLENGFEVLLSGTWRSSGGERVVGVPDYASINQGHAENLDGSRSPTGWLSLKWQDFTLEGSFMDRRKDIPGAFGGIEFDTKPAWQEDEREFLGLRFEHGSSEDFRIVATAYYDRYVGTLRGAYDSVDFGGLEGQTLLNQDRGSADWVDCSIQVDKTLWERQVLTLGGDYQNNFRVEQESTTFTSPASVFRQSTNTANFGLFGQDEITLARGLLLNAGLRYDYYDIFGATVDPRASLIYDTGFGTTLKFIFGDAFRSPNLYERFYDFPGYSGNSNLHPEHVRSYEFLAEQALGSHIRMGGNLFYNDIDHLITQGYDASEGVYIYNNTDQVTTQGAEFELDGRWSHGIQGRISYTFTDAEESSASLVRQRPPNSPRHLGKADLTVPLWPSNLFATAELECFSSRLTSDGSLPANAVVNLTLFARQVISGMDISVSAYNVFDQRFQDPVSPDFAPVTAIQQIGRSLRAKLTYHF